MSKPRSFPLLRFFIDGLKTAIHGDLRYHLWMSVLSLAMLWGTYAYSIQIQHGLGVTGMSRRVC